LVNQNSGSRKRPRKGERRPQIESRNERAAEGAFVRLPVKVH
jgi:hypothetical protein